jgi:hypothetical protein
MSMSMNGRKMLNIFAILGTLSLVLGNIALPSYAFLKHTSQSQVNTDPGIDKQVLEGVALILKGVNTILMGKTSGGLDEVSLGTNMIRTSCNITNGENRANGSSGNGANGGQGGEGGKGGSVYCASAGSAAIGSNGGSAAIGGAGGGGGGS